MSGGGAVPGTPPEYRRQVERLVARLQEAEGAIQSMAAGELDAVLDPATAAPILLSKAQEAVARSEARYRDLVNRAPSVLCEMQPDGTLLFANRAMQTVLGHAPDALVGTHWLERLCPEPETAPALLRKLAGGDVTGEELPLLAASGQTRWVAFNSANRYAGGVLEAVILFGVDVTDRREAEARARELAEAQVARAEAEAANRAKTQFLAVMSHELRTPLNAVIGYVQLLEMELRGPVTPEQTEDLQRIRRSTLHLLGLINDLLNFVRLEAGRVDFHNDVIPMEGVLETIETVTAPQASEKGLALSIARCPPDLTAWGDREKVQQILINLVSNAIKFTPPGGSIGVECTATGDETYVVVRDDGMGISPAKLNTIFDPFVQVDKNLTREQEGVGLGLAISRDLARQMNGNVAVESTEGAGSVFTLSLPRREGDRASAAAHSA